MADDTTNGAPLIATPCDFGNFALERELGHGGMGGVYLGRDKMLDRPVAIKVMLKSYGEDPTFVERFQREAQAAARLNHPNIAQIYSFGQEQGMPYIAMEVCGGGSLDKDMQESPGTMSPVRVMRIGRQMAEALNVAAESGLVHGDVKPENVLYDADGNAKLVDFGLAAMQGDSDEIWGTPYYISPEKCRKQPIDYRADIYSLGGTLYHALTGVAPFEGEDATAVVKARFEGAPRKPSEVRPDLPPELDDIIMRMLEVEPGRRYPTYESLLGDIKRYLDKAGPEKTSGGPRIKLKKKKKMSLSGATTVSATVTELGDSMAEATLPTTMGGVLGDLTAATVGADEDDENKKHMSIGAIVGLVVGGIFLVIGLLVGGLVWYSHASKQAEIEKELALIDQKQGEARVAIDKAKKAARDFGAHFHELAARATENMNTAVAQVKGSLSDEMIEEARDMLAKPDSKEIADAIAYTNEVFEAYAAQEAAEAAAKAAAAEAAKAAAAAEAAKAAGETNAAPAEAAAPAATNAPAAEAAAPAKAEAAQKAEAPKTETPKAEAPKTEEPAKAEEPPAPKVELPAALKEFAALWADVATCEGADIRVQGRVALLLKQADKAKALVARDVKTTEALAAFSAKLIEGLEAIKAMKCVEQAQRKAGVIKAKTTNLPKTIERQAKSLIAKMAKAAKEKAEKEAKEAAEAKEAEEHKAMAEAETKKAQDKFDSYVGQFRHLSFEFPLKQLKTLEQNMETQEGRDAAKLQQQKVICMDALLRHLQKYSRGFRFNSGRYVEKVDAKEIVIATPKSKVEKGKKVKLPPELQRYNWEKFYKTQKGLLNQLIIGLLEKGREVTRVGPKDWSNAMLGAALTMKTLFSDDLAVEKRSQQLVTKAVEGFGSCRRWAAKMFPEMELPAGEEF